MDKFDVKLYKTQIKIDKFNNKVDKAYMNGNNLHPLVDLLAQLAFWAS